MQPKCFGMVYERHHVCFFQPLPARLYLPDLYTHFYCEPFHPQASVHLIPTAYNTLPRLILFLTPTYLSKPNKKEFPSLESIL